MKDKISILLVEDSEDDAILIKRELIKDGLSVEINRVETSESMKKALKNNDWDIVLADYMLPKFSGMNALKILKESNKIIPFILVSGKIGEDPAVEAMKAGADDYIMKNNLKKLAPAIKRELNDYEMRRKEKQARDEIEAYHEKLERINKQLQNEISDRKEAERNAIEAKEYLQNVIDSTSKCIISINDNGRITTWNAVIEKLTGYDNKSVMNRTMSKLDLFYDDKQINDAIKDILMGNRTEFDCVVISKDNVKLILRLKGNLLRGKGSKKIGIIFIGEDITRDAEMHGKLLEGNSYLVSESKIEDAMDFFNDMISPDRKGLFISRVNPDEIVSMIPSTSNITIHLICKEKISEYENITDLNTLISMIRRFCESSENPIVFLDGIHYFLIKYSFNEFVDALFSINEIVNKTKAMMFVRLDPSMIQKNEMAIIENELRTLPSKKISGITLEDSVYDILKFIFQQNQNNALVPFKKVLSKFKISYSTAAKRIEELEEKGLIFTRRKGKLRAIYVSDKGKTLLHKRDIA